MPTPPTRPGGVYFISAVWPFRHTRATRQRRPSLSAEPRRESGASRPGCRRSQSRARWLGGGVRWRGRPAGGGAAAAATREVASDRSGARACSCTQRAARRAVSVGRGSGTGPPRGLVRKNAKKSRNKDYFRFRFFSHATQAHALYDHDSLDARFRTTLRVSFHHRLEHEPKV